MELILMLVAPFPLGLFVRSQVAGYLAYTALHAYVFTFQSLLLVMEWINGDASAFGVYPDHGSVWAYGLVNLVIYLVGLGLVALGHRLALRRRNRAAASVQLDPVGVDAV